MKFVTVQDALNNVVRELLALGHVPTLGEYRVIKEHWAVDLSCSFCGIDHGAAVIVESWEDAESNTHDIYICPECINDMYNLIQNKTT